MGNLLLEYSVYFRNKIFLIVLLRAKPNSFFHSIICVNNYRLEQFDPCLEYHVCSFRYAKIHTRCFCKGFCIDRCCFAICHTEAFSLLRHAIEPAIFRFPLRGKIATSVSFFAELQSIS